MKDDGFVAALRACQTREQVWDLISGARPAY